MVAELKEMQSTWLQTSLDIDADIHSQDSSTQLHLFLDSTNSSVDSSVSQRSSPHMFLSYANADEPNMRNDSCRTMVMPQTNPNHGRPPRGNRHVRTRRQSGTPHLFLNYAANRDDSEVADDAVDRHQAPTSPPWGASLDEFQLGCKKFMHNDQGLTDTRAEVVSMALMKAIQKTNERCGTNNDNEGDRNAMYASFLKDAFSDPPLEPDNDDYSMTLSEVARGSERHLESSSEEEVVQHKRQLERQDQEILFLRSALKALVESERDQDNAIVEFPVRQRQESIERCDDDSKHIFADGIPYNIEVPLLTTVVDDLTEEPTVCLNSREIELQTNRVQSIPASSDLALGDQERLPVATAVYRPLRTPSFDFEQSKLLKSTCNSGTASYMAAMKLVYQVRSDLNQSASSFTEMYKGEIQSKRARGMICQVYFRSWGVALQGRYNGMLRDGLPHGSGVMRFDNRDYYIGEFAEGALHGQGSLFLRRDRRLLTFRGRFHNSEFVGWDPQGPSSEDTVSAGAA